MFAFVFESVGSGEWLVLLAVILIVVGPKNLPSAARKMGQVMSKLRRAADDIKRDYIDIPEDSADRSITDIAGDNASSDDPGYDNPDDPGHMSDYPEGYPEDDYYGSADGMDADVPPEHGMPEPTEEPAVAAAETAEASAAETAAKTEPQEAQKTTNG